MTEPKLYKDYMDPRNWEKTDADEKPERNILPYFKPELGTAPKPEPEPKPEPVKPKPSRTRTKKTSA